jgi:hypothetical protein
MATGDSCHAHAFRGTHYKSSTNKYSSFPVLLTSPPLLRLGLRCKKCRRQWRRQRRNAGQCTCTGLRGNFPCLLDPARSPARGSRALGIRSGRSVLPPHLLELVLPSATREKESKLCRTSFGAVAPPTQGGGEWKKAKVIQGLHSMQSAKPRRITKI